jgi:hypothetical protein
MKISEPDKLRTLAIQMLNQVDGDIAKASPRLARAVMRDPSLVMTLCHQYLRQLPAEFRKTKHLTCYIA